MTLKGSHKLIDALLYLKISGSLVVASAEVSECKRVRVCVSTLAYKGAWAFFVGFTVWTARVHVGMCARTCVDIRSPLLPSSLSLHCRRGESSVTGWLGEIRCEQRITCSIWPGSGEHHDVSSSFQPDGARGGGPLCLSANTHFSPSRSGGSPVYVCEMK